MNEFFAFFSSSLLYAVLSHFKTGCVFNGSDLGKEHSAKGLMNRCTKQSENPVTQRMRINQEIGDDKFEQPENLQSSVLKTIDELIKPEMNQNANKPFEQIQSKKKKRLKQEL